MGTRGIRKDRVGNGEFGGSNATLKHATLGSFECQMICIISLLNHCLQELLAHRVVLSKPSSHLHDKEGGLEKRQGLGSLIIVTVFGDITEEFYKFKYLFKAIKSRNRVLFHL